MNKRQRVLQRRNRVFQTIGRDGHELFHHIVFKTNFSRDEVAFHLSILTKKGFVRGDAKNGYSKAEESPRGITPSEYRDLVRSYNTFLHGCENPTHVFGFGHLASSHYGGRLDG